MRALRNFVVFLTRRFRAPSLNNPARRLAYRNGKMDNSPAMSVREVIERWPKPERLYKVALAEQHFLKAGDLEVVRELRAYRRTLNPSN